MEVMAGQVSRVVTLPERGRLIVATDLQGNLGDFERVEELFERRVASKQGAVLVITGDLVHGPELAPSDWPDYLGTYYRGDSKSVLMRAKKLADRHPGRVHYLLGNHEHAHVGGPVVAKFFPDEAHRLEELLGEETTEQTRAWLRTWPFVAVAPAARIVMTHAAPHASISRAEDLDDLPLEGFMETSWMESTPRATLAALLWARTTSTERAHAFLRSIHPDARVAVYGHDVARAGYAIDREPLLCLSTSFGLYDGDKLYMEWDLSEPASSAAQLAAQALHPLHPESTPVFRNPA